MAVIVTQPINNIHKQKEAPEAAREKAGVMSYKQMKYFAYRQFFS